VQLTIKAILRHRLVRRNQLNFFDEIIFSTKSVFVENSALRIFSIYTFFVILLKIEANV